jgi:hypothetical protein
MPAAAAGSSNAGCVAAAVISVLVMLLMGAGGAAYFLTASADVSSGAPPEVAESAAPVDESPAPVAASPGGPSAGVEAAGAAPAAGDYFADAPAVQTAIADRFTSRAELRELVLYPGQAIFELRDAVARDNVDRYILRPTGLSEPDPERLSSRDKKELDAAVFPLSDVDFKLVPELVADAQKKLDYDNGKVTHVIIDKFFPFRKALGFRVYVSSERDSGYVNYDARGKLIKVVQ